MPGMAGADNAHQHSGPIHQPAQPPYFCVFTAILRCLHSQCPQVDGKRISTIKDLKDSGRNTRTSSIYSLKGTLNGAIKPAKERYKIEILKSCSTAIGCVTIPDPAKVFVNAAGHVAYAFWNVGQSLTVNGVQVKDHAWCPVQTAIVVR